MQKIVQCTITYSQNSPELNIIESVWDYINQEQLRIYRNALNSLHAKYL